MEPPIPTIDWWTLAPIIVVVCTGIVGLVIEMLRPKRNNNAIVGVSLLGLVGAALTVLPQFSMAPGQTFAAMHLRDGLGLVLQLVLIGVAFLTVLFSEGYLREKRIAFGEFYPLVLWSTAGGMMMVTTTNLLMLFLGLEVLSIALYCLAGLSRSEQRSEEGALKYFLLGAFASAFLLFGIALIFGATGSIDMSALGYPLERLENLKGLHVFGLGFLLVGLGFKAALVPFHQWTPDVYQGSPTNVTAFMSGASKVAAFGALVRVLQAAAPVQEVWFPILAVLAVATMTLGNLVALAQKDVKRALGYSSVAHAGYVLVALLAHLQAPDKVPLATTVFYLAAYSLMTLGAFAVVSLVAEGGKEGTRFQDLQGLWKRAPFAVVCLVVFVASLIGVPPTGGFFGKLFIFKDAMTAGLTWLAIALAVNSAISVYYYLGILQAAFVSDEGALQNRAARPTAGLNLTVLACAVGVFFVTVWAAPIGGTLPAAAPPVARPEADPGSIGGAVETTQVSVAR